nr:MAG TPA: hypothetical protein [Caudoviricetes sp.]
MCVGNLITPRKAGFFLAWPNQSASSTSEKKRLISSRIASLDG